MNRTIPNLIAIAGTNASGRSGIAMQPARAFGGEVISADSRQVFRGLDLGSGKIPPAEMQGVPHHPLGVCEPGDFFLHGGFSEAFVPGGGRYHREAGCSSRRVSARLTLLAILDRDYKECYCPRKQASRT